MTTDTISTPFFLLLFRFIEGRGLLATSYPNGKPALQSPSKEYLLYQWDTTSGVEWGLLPLFPVCGLFGARRYRAWLYLVGSNPAVLLVRSNSVSQPVGHDACESGSWAFAGFLMREWLCLFVLVPMPRLVGHHSKKSGNHSFIPRGSKNAEANRPCQHVVVRPLT